MDNHEQKAEYRKLERMTDFFIARLDSYEEHMLTDAGKDAYEKLAELVPGNTKKLLDLRCGTGLELDEIFKRLPSVSVIGIDLTQEMLDKLKQKHPDKDIKFICGNYFDIDLGKNTFDTAVSFQTMHHFSHEEKVGLYRRIHRALKPKGVYIEADSIVPEQSVEDELYAENARVRREMNIPEGKFYHFDTPCTVDNQVAMFMQAGFVSTDVVSKTEKSAIMVARK
ncbi:class I SAM-dependent methyltransferase [Chloroflexota bacterium]